MAEHGAYLAFDIYPSDAPRTGDRLCRLTKDDLLPETFYRHAVPVGNGAIQLHADDPNIAYLKPGNYVRVVDLNLDEVIGGFWLEDGAETILTKSSQEGEKRNLSGPGTGYYLHRGTFPTTLRSPVDEALSLHQSQVDLTGELTFTGPETYGGIAGRIIYETRLDDPSAVPELPGHSWDDVNDSGGTAWAVFAGEYTITAADNSFDLLTEIARKGVDWWLDPHTFVPEAYQEGTYGTDRTSGTFASGKVRFQKAVNIGADLDKSIYRLPYISHMEVIGSDGTTRVMVVDPGWSPGDEVRRGTLRLSATVDEDILTDAGEQAILARKLQEDQARFPIRYGTDVGTGHYIPGPPGSGGHFWWHDLVTIHTGTDDSDYDEQAIRVEAIEWRMRSTGDFQVWVELGAQYLDNVAAAEIRSLTTIVNNPGSGCGCPQGCHTVIGGEPTFNVQDYLSYESGEEQWNAPYGGPGNVLIRDTGYGSGAGLYYGRFGPTSLSHPRIVTPGDVIRVVADSRGYYESYPTTPHGFVNWSWGIAFYDASDVELSVHVAAQYTSEPWTYIPGDLASWQGPDSVQATVPPTAAYMRLVTDVAGLGNESNNQHMDEIYVGTVTGTGEAWSYDDLTGNPPGFAWCNHNHLAEDLLTEETDSDLVLAPDGSGGTHWVTPPAGGAPDIDAGTTIETDTGLVLAPDGSGGVTWVPAGGGGSLPWFDVTAYGATGDGTTDDTSDINAAIAVWNSAGRGILYFPAGTYKVTGALTTVTASGVVLGDGMGAYDGSDDVSAIRCTSATAVLFTITGNTVIFRDIGLFNTAGSTPSAGAGIQVSGSFIGQKVDLESVVLNGFYRNIDRQVGAQWSNHNVWNWGAVLDGERIQNTVNQDAGDWVIEGCYYYADTDDPAALIRQIGAGGGKIIGNKFNGHGGAKAVNSILVAIPNGVASSVLVISGNSFENMSGDAILITTTGTGHFGAIAISGNQFGMYSNNAGRTVKLSAATNGTPGANGSLTLITIDGGTMYTDGTARPAIELINTNLVTLGDFQISGFNARYTSTGGTNTTDSTVSGGAKQVIARNGIARTSGNITLNSASEASVDTGIDLVLPAANGDIVEVDINALLGNEAVIVNLDVCTLVGGSPVHYFGPGLSGSAQGLLGWSKQEAHYTPVTGSVTGVLDATDVSGGNVTLRLRYKTAGGAATLFSTANLRFWWGAVVLRAAP